MTFYTSINNNHSAVITLFKEDSTILDDVATKNIIDYDFQLLSQKRFPAIAVPLPEYRPGKVDGLGMTTYELIYKVQVATDMLGSEKTRKQLMTLALRVIELLETLSNQNLDQTCTYTQLLNFNPNYKIAGSEKSMQRVGLIQFMTAHNIITPQ